MATATVNTNASTTSHATPNGAAVRPANSAGEAMNTFAQAMDTWVSTSRRMTESIMNSAMSMTPAPINGTNGTNGANATDASARKQAVNAFFGPHFFGPHFFGPHFFGPQMDAMQTMQNMMAPLATSFSRMTRGSVEMMANGAAEAATLVGEQIRFAGRVSERSMDCVVGQHAARTPEALIATTNTIVSDCMDHATATGERAMRTATRVMQQLQEIGSERCSTPAGTACCTK